MFSLLKRGAERGERERMNHALGVEFSTGTGSQLLKRSQKMFCFSYICVGRRENLVELVVAAPPGHIKWLKVTFGGKMGAPVLKYSSIDFDSMDQEFELTEVFSEAFISHALVCYNSFLPFPNLFCPRNRTFSIVVVFVWISSLFEKK